MGFQVSLKLGAFERSTGRCECKRREHEHIGRCKVLLTASSAVFYHKKAFSRGGDDSLSNCAVLCDPCHRLILAAGRRKATSES